MNQVYNLQQGLVGPFFRIITDLTPHPLLVPWSRKSKVIPPLPLWAVRPVQSLSACTRVHFTLFMLKCAPSDVYFILHTVSDTLKEGLEEVVVANFTE